MDAVEIFSHVANLGDARSLIIHSASTTHRVSKGAATYVRLITGMPITDPTGGYKCYRRRVLEAIDLDVQGFLDTDQSGQFAFALLYIVVLDHERGFPVVAIRNQWIVGLELLVDAFGLEDLFDAQHFLDLVLDGQTVFEIQGGVGPQRHLAGFLVLHDLPAILGPFDRIFFQ